MATPNPNTRPAGIIHTGGQLIALGNYTPPKRKTKEDQELTQLIAKLSEFNTALKMLKLTIDDIDNPANTETLKEAAGELLTQVITQINDCFSKIKTILESKAEIDINYQDPATKVSYLHTAAGMGSLKLVTLLLMRNPNPHLQNCFNQTPAHRAMLWGQSAKIAQFLINYEKEYDLKQANDQKDNLSSTTTASSLSTATAISSSNDAPSSSSSNTSNNNGSNGPILTAFANNTASSAVSQTTSSSTSLISSASVAPSANASEVENPEKLSANLL